MELAILLLVVVACVVLIGVISYGIGYRNGIQGRIEVAVERICRDALEEDEEEEHEEHAE